MADDARTAEFIAVTGADEATAAFFLSSTSGDLDSAVSAYFDSGGITVPSSSIGEASSSAAVSSAPDSSHAPAPPQPADSTSRSRQQRGGFATLASLGKPDSDDDESGKNYYAGGEKSGQMIQDPRGRRRDRSGHTGSLRRDDNAEGAGASGGPSTSDEVAQAIFDRARERGPLSDAERAEFHGPQNFVGAGYRLGDSRSAGGESSGPDVIGRRNVTRTLTFYADGFTVDEGPLRAFDDPANAAFLQEINRGFVPKEMEEPGIGNVSIDLIDKKDTNYEPPKPGIVPFSGGGNRLGSVAESSAAPTDSAVPDASAAAEAVVVDESRPIATVQVRLSDGSRLTVRLNEDHTVQHLRNFVAASRPGVPSFTLATTFPRKTLSDYCQTIKEANLNGAVVIQSKS